MQQRDLSGQKPSSSELRKEDANVRRYIRDWDKLILKPGVLYRKKMESEGQESHQLAVPAPVKHIV